MSLIERTAAMRSDPDGFGSVISDTLREVVDLLSREPDASATRTALVLLRGLEAELPSSVPVRAKAANDAGFDVAALSSRVTKALQQRAALPEALEPSQAFRWESDASGDICWVEGAPRAALIGRSVLPSDRCKGQERSAFRDRMVSIPGEGVVAGGWLVSGVPFFDSATGRFLGFRGSAHRAEDARIEPIGVDDPDLIRQLVHELRTPLNAILGFAGLIEGEFLGPAEPAYRIRAERIGEEAKRVLEAVEELDRNARACSTVKA